VVQMKMVHCINAGADCDLGNKQVTQFVDGFQAAQQLKTKYPVQFRLLSSVKMDFFSIGHDAIMMSRHPTIKCVYLIVMYLLLIHHHFIFITYFIVLLHILFYLSYTILPFICGKLESLH